MEAERARLFVALELPAAPRGALVRWRDALDLSGLGFRALAPEALHATLCFLGWRLASEGEAISSACRAAIHDRGAPWTRFDQVLWLPSRSPRVLAVGLKDPGGALAALQASIASALSVGGWYTPERRPFLAHVTVARAMRGKRARREQMEAPPAHAFPAAAVVLYRSRLERGGARYEPLTRVELPSGA